MKKYIMLNANGSYSKETTDQFTLPWMQEKIGGYITGLFIKPNVSFWVDEEGLLKNLPINEVGSVIAIGMNRIPFTHPLVGPVLIAGSVDKKSGELHGLSSKTISEAIEIIDTIKAKRDEMAKMIKEHEAELAHGYL